jgi:protein-disulfide isomerase
MKAAAGKRAMNPLTRVVTTVLAKRPTRPVVFAAVLASCVTSTAIVQIAVFKHLDRLDERLSAIDAALMAQRKAASGKRISIDTVPFMGNPAARAIVIQYTDFDCPFCLSFAKDTLPEFIRTYVDSGRVRFALRHLPLEKIHPHAARAAAAAECGGRQGKFWEMHNALFDKPSARDLRDLLHLGKAIGLNAEVFGTCLKGEAAARINADVESARELRIKGTPTFVFGESESDGIVRVTRVQSGVPRIATLRSIVDDLLRGVAPPPE